MKPHCKPVARSDRQKVGTTFSVKTWDTFEQSSVTTSRMGLNMAGYTISVNGESHHIDATSDMPLLWVLRDLIGLTGSKYGCGIGSCGACTVLIDGKEQQSCQVPISEVGSRKVITIEGLSKDGSHPLQKAWVATDVPQCGYCQAGQIMTAAALLLENPHPDDAAIEQAMSVRLCRCGTYPRIKAAIKEAAKESVR